MANSASTIREFFNARARYLVFGCVLLVVLPNSTSAQTSVTDGSTPLALAPGAPAGSYALSGFDNINAYNGGLTFSLPLLHIGGRGGAGYTMVLPLETHWRVLHKSNDYQEIELPESNFWGTITPRYTAGELKGRVGTDPVCSSFQVVRTLSRLTFTTPDGTEYELRDQLTGGQPQSYYCGGGAPYPSRGTVFVTADGTSVTFISDTTIRDDSTALNPSGYLLLRDGTRYRIDMGSVTWMRDRNGNKLTFSYGFYLMTITDSLNRQVSVNYADFQTTFYDQITFKGYGGTQRSIRVNYASLQSVLRTNRPGDLSTVQTKKALFPNLTGSSSTYFNPYVVSSVVLPDGVQQYQFLYNVYGELARVTLPTGGAFEYDFGNGILNDVLSGVVSSDSPPEIYRRVLQRRVYLDAGITLEGLMTYSRPESTTGTAAYVEVDHLKADGSTLIARERRYFYGAASSSLLQGPLDYPGYLEGKEYQTEAISSDGVTVLRRVVHNWQQGCTVSPWNSAIPNNARVVETDTTLVDTNQMAKQTFAYDCFNNKTDTYEYDFGSGVAGALMRYSHTDYVTATSYTDGVIGAHLRSLPIQASVFDANGIERARTTNEYDNYTPDGANHAGLVDRPSISGLDSSSTTSYTTRGNATATTHYLLDSNGSVIGSISAYAQYDIAGNVVKAIDARGYATTLDYRDNFGAPTDAVESSGQPTNSAPAELAGFSAYGFPFAVTNALGQTVYAKFDYYLGRAVDSEDANGVASSAYYGDLLDRPTQVIRAANQGTDIKSQSTFAYDDANRVITTTSDQNSYGDNLLKGQMVYDGLGRTIESRHYEGGTNYIAAQTQYDALGRAFKASNPFRPWNSETAVWTTSAFDALGRIVTITTPDNAVVTTSYSGNTVTVTDQAAKQRKSVTDGLGRLIQVYEDPAGLNYLTSCSYDTLDNLITVNQGSQTRSFVYDSLKRLSSATNPESGAISYQYDANGNLTQKTDARSIVSTYVYDALNRATSRSYSDSTPPVTYGYDAVGVTNSKGRLTSVSSSVSSYTYSSYDAIGRVLGESQIIGSQTYSMTYSYDLAGHLLSETYPSGRTVTNAYDSVGRTASVNGNLGDGISRTYSTGIVYDAASHMAKEQFGTATPIYNKLFYNVRGQLSEIRESTSYTGPTDTTWDRGAIINNYSLQAGCVGASCNATDNNGNLMRQDVYIPGGAVFSQFYGYDPLNRLQSVREDGPPGPANWQQAFTYDQYGNRKINTAATWGNGINNMQAAVDPNATKNRMYAPGETDQNHFLIDYDNAGNQKKDYYSYSANGVVYDRTYDAENRMKSSTATYSSPAGIQTSTYTYDGDGRRVKRNIGGTETWQVYGLGGELLAEYAANADHLTPQKEYGYRNGQLLVIATAPSGLAANKPPTARPGAGAAESSAASREPRATEATQSGDLLASNKSSDLAQWAGVGERTEALSDISTPLYGPSFSYGSLRSGLFPIPPQSGPTKIAFASNRDGSAQIYSMNSDGTGLSRLTNDAANDEAPNWSPNNSRIVFQSDRDNLFSGLADIYVMNWDGSGQTRLTSDPADDSAPVWSPDGTKIAFQSARNGVNYQVYVMNADGSGQVNISNSTANDTQPSWSPDGSKIAFASDRNQAGFSSIYVMNANGTSQTRLTVAGTGLLDQQPTWSPDGSKLTFTSRRDSVLVTWTETDDNGGVVTKSKLNVNKEVYVMNSDGTNQTRLTNNLANDDSPSWSPDSTKIVFRSDRERDCCDPTPQVWVMNPDGSSPVKLSNNGYDEHCPSWQHSAANVPPTVSLTSPANGATFIAPANITLTANASDSDGSVTRVDFYQGVTLIGTATTSPYTVTWNNVGVGSYSLTARATDNGGASTTSAAVTITVNPNSPPAVSITGPTNGAVFIAPANITVTANASDSDGSVSRVDFYQGATLIGTSTTSPYTISWNSVAAGSYTLTARATDNLGATTTSAPVNITVDAPPTVSITSPANGATFTAPANITVTANASDSDGTVSRVDFYQGTTLIGTATTSPYALSWNNVAAGGYTLTAKATDNLGASTTSAPISITVGSPPTVSVTSPANGASFTAPANVTITANASSSSGSINRVEFYQGTTLIGTSTASPYTVTWNNVTAGSYSLKARAIDNSSASTDSTPVNISVDAPPTVSITSPTNGASFNAPASITISANASDSDGTVSRVDFYQGTTLIGTATTAPFSTNWNNVTAGSYSLTAKATDNLGAQTTSTAVNITVIACCRYSLDRN